MGGYDTISSIEEQCLIQLIVLAEQSSLCTESLGSGDVFNRVRTVADKSWPSISSQVERDACFDVLKWS